MSLRSRIAGAASISVAVAVLAAAVGVYFAVRSDLRGGIDRFLHLRALSLQSMAASSGARGRLPPPPALKSQRGRPPGGRFDGGGFPPQLEPAVFGAASGYAQFISPSGSLLVPGGQAASPEISLVAADRRIARSGRGSLLTDRRVHGTELRVLTAGIGAAGAVLIARPLTEVNRDLDSLLPLLALVAVGGVLMAALLGMLVARTALVPISRFTARTEELTGSLDLAQRLEIEGRDELARLAQSFNITLAALDRSVEAQRQLIADASHELRTPIASLQANIQILHEAEGLSASEQSALRGDIEEELVELASLVSDVVELARGAKPVDALDEVRLDQIVSDAIERAGRRSGARFHAHLEPTLVRAQGLRVDRAVANLLDNAAKWSPPQGSIEVELRDGVLSVRDHGPGFDEADLPLVFDRFYRADRARKLPGSGLGLAIVRQVAEAHRGFAQASNAPAGGALLRVSFGPAIELGPQGQSAPASA